MRLCALWRASFALFAVSMLLVQVGCGGGGGVSNRLTRVNTLTFSDDAKVLALRETTGPWIDADRVAAFDTDLKRVKSQFPVVNSIRAFPRFVIDELWVGVKSGTPWLSRWDQGDLTTGVTALDALLKKYDAVSVQFIYHMDAGTPHDSYLIRFAQPLNFEVVAPECKATSAAFDFCDPNYYGGDGDDIRYEVQNGLKVYTFIHGFGDCPAGCTAAHLWTFTLQGDGTIGVVESGTPLSQDPNWLGRAASTKETVTTAASRKDRTLRRALRANR